MRRAIETHLLAWKDKPNRLPLIIKGARQVGKTYLMRWFGENHFSKYAYFNFDERPELNEFFEKNKDVNRILDALSIISGVDIDTDTLLILDEIQECPKALNTLKYFSENKPELPVICAGSLLGILLHSGFSFPVGKVEFLTLYPMTFREVIPYFDEKSFKYLEQINDFEPIPELFYNDLLDNFKKYMVTGGMPAVVKSYIQDRTFENSEQILQNLILSYQGDFAKHPVMHDVSKITHVFESIPAQLSKENKKFVFRLVRSGARAREYKDAIQWLIQSGLVHRVVLSAKPGIPLSAYDHPGAFKLYALDIGIIRRLSKLSPLAYAEGNRLFTEYKGALTENFILQSLVTQFEVAPRYWTSGNTAEIDFLIQHENEIFPIEVKSEENIKSRSMAVFHQKFNPQIRIRFSLRNLNLSDGLINIPHFMVDYTRDLIKRFHKL